jgi:hypothetical protein
MPRLQRRFRGKREEMAGKREKGKIPRGEWPNISARYSRGETMAQLARAYGCTAPAIRYIAKRSGMPNDEAGGEGALVAAISHGSAARPAAHSASPRSIRGHILGPELRQRISGDVASFLVALDYVDLEGTLESMANLQESTDRLMRSAARTRLELERLLSGHKASGLREKLSKKTRSPHGST